jgi:ATP-dependent Clp protease ATP-binding subunit ClpA
MRLLARERGRRPRSKTIRPAKRYLAGGAEEARRLGCGFIGTEHVLLALSRDRADGSASTPARLGVEPAAVESALAPWLGPGPVRPKIDRDALASLGIDFEAVRARIEDSFGPGALERTSASCLGVAPQLKLALAHALDHAGETPLRDEHVLLGMLSVPDSAAGRALTSLGVTAEAVQALLRVEPGSR